MNMIFYLSFSKLVISMLNPDKLLYLVGVPKTLIFFNPRGFSIFVKFSNNPSTFLVNSFP